MKILSKYLSLLTLILVCFNYTACSSNNNDEPSIPDSPEDNLPEEARAFVGYWIRQNDTGYLDSDFLFFSDGTCWKMNNGRELYYWTYNPQTSILATTTPESDQWTVTLSNENAWSGIYIKSGNPHTFQRNSNKLDYMETIIEHSIWKESADSILHISSYEAVRYSGGYHCGFNIGSQTTFRFGKKNNFNFLLLYEDENIDDYTFDYIIWEKGYYALAGLTGTVSLLNPMNLNKQKLVFTGYMNKTLSRSAE